MNQQTYFSFALSAILMAGSASSLQAQGDLDSYEAVSWESPTGDKFNYSWRAPDKMKKAETYPLLFFLHGAGGRGDDNKRQLSDAGGVQAFAKQGVSSRRQSYVFAGQVPKSQRWVDVHWNTL